MINTIHEKIKKIYSKNKKLSIIVDIIFIKNKINLLKNKQDKFTRNIISWHMQDLNKSVEMLKLLRSK